MICDTNNLPLCSEVSTLIVAVNSQATKSNDSKPSRVNNAEIRQESQRAKRVRKVSSVSIEASMNDNNNNNNVQYEIFYPIEVNGKCKVCDKMLGGKISEVEKHLSNHGISECIYKCSVCKKTWPSWRSVVVHYNKSACRTVKPDEMVVEDDKEDDDDVKLTQESERNDGLYYCSHCASKGWEKKVGLSQHMRHMHPQEYNATIPVAANKKRWTSDEVRVLAELEASIPLKESACINQLLAEKFKSRSFDAIKSQRKREDYRDLVALIRKESNKMKPKRKKPEPKVTGSGRSPHVTVPSQPDRTSLPDVKKYIKDKYIDAHQVISSRMKDAMLSFVDGDNHNDVVEETLNVINEIIVAKRAKQNRSQSKRRTQEQEGRKEQKPKSVKSKAKADKYSRYQRLFKVDKSKLAAEILDDVDNTAKKPPMSEAHAHFQKIWDRDGEDKDDVLIDTIRDEAYTLLSPVSCEEIDTAIQNTRPGTAAGPDRITIKELKSISSHELCCAYNVWLGTRRIPTAMKENRTILLPKSNSGLDQIKNWRPITISSLLVRIYNKIMAKRLQKVFATSDKQTGFKEMNGIGLNTATLHHLLKHARQNKNDLYVILLDVSKAFDSIPHESIRRALRRNGCPPEFIEMVSDQYTDIYTTIRYDQRSSIPIRIRRGVKQGDPMSSILFNLVIDELFTRIGESYGYEINEVGKVNARAFADDIALYSGSEIGMQELLKITEEFLKERGLELNVSKCVAIGIRKAGKVKKTQIVDSQVKNPPLFAVNNEPIRFLAIHEKCKYLGVEYTPLGTANLSATMNKIRTSLKKLKKAPLKPQQKIVLLRSYLIPRYIFTFTYTECYPKAMGIIDRYIRQWLKSILKLPTSVSNEFFYLPTKEGGLGIGKMYDVIAGSKLRLHKIIGNSRDTCAKYLIETQASGMHMRWCQALGVNSHPANAEIENRKAQKLDENRARYQLTVHGSNHEGFQYNSNTNRWLEGNTRLMSGKTFIRAIHMRTNTIATRVTASRGRNADKTCRRCGFESETLIHILQACPITQGMRCTRHNNIVRKVVAKLVEKQYEVHTEQGIPTPGERTNISRPDIIAIKDDCALVLDATCVFESTKVSLQAAYNRKIDRYKNLEPLIKSKYSVRNVEFHGLCVGSRGTVDRNHNSIWQLIGFSQNDLQLLAISTIEDSSKIITIFNDSNRLRI